LSQKFYTFLPSGLRVPLYILVVGLIAACQGEKKSSFQVEDQDTTITSSNAFNQLFLDSAALTTFLGSGMVHDSLSARMRSFYNRRNYQFAWFFPTGMAEYVHTFMNMQGQYLYYARDSTIYYPGLRARIDSLTTVKEINPDDSLVKETELLLTYQFFRYAYYAYSGDRRINPKDLGWFIPRKKLDLVPFLDSLVANQGKRVEEYEPVNRQYNLLKEYLFSYHQLGDTLPWPVLTTPKKGLKEGDKSVLIPDVRKRLALLGYGIDSEADSLDLVTAAMVKRVAEFQKHHGVKDDGILGNGFFEKLNISPKERIRQILINMERIRWMPDNPDSDYLLVNIPEYRLHVYEDGKHSFDMEVVVGSTAHNTVVFSDVVSQVVFSPYWNVPASILKNEIMPGIEKDPGYLARHNMEWNGKSVRQKPGPRNSLGLVKFLFPNSYNIYLHDTPSKRLFDESKRAFSHGCIRVSEPRKLAEFLLRKDSTWTSEKIVAAMNAGKERGVRLKPESQIPVVIGYFTAWVDREGKLNLRNDVYGHDKKMAARYFGDKPL
jgi:murein L,D-transpeptidase YcbB/YkuD